jgi:ABC-2 type transport system ATP-binding protein
VIDGGRLLALGTPTALADQGAGAVRLRFVPSAPFDDSAATVLDGVQGVERAGSAVVVTGSGDIVGEVVAVLAAAGVRTRDLKVETGSLEDAFLRLTGQTSNEHGEVLSR